jgi:pilus assembly protein FimV
LIAKSHRWRVTAIAAAALMGLWGTNAMALSLGRINVQSALGEPLRAEIDIPDINAEEAATLKTSIAAPEAFKLAGMDYNAAMPGLKATLQRLSDGRAVIRLTGDRAINDPFLDLILVANWSTGRIVRDYTLLFDPPSLRKAAPAAPTQAQIPAQPLAPAAPAPVVQQPRTVATPPPPAPVSATKTPSKEPTQAQPINTDASKQVLVKAGDTAGRIAAAVKPASVSLDQMLVALLRSNPDAFLGENVNRVKAGAIIDIPTAEQAAATPSGQASQMIVAQSKDFNEFRRKLAGSAPTAEVAVADRQASGSIQTKVEEKKALQPTPDKLTLSKGAVQAQLADEQLAKDRAAKDAASRTAEIEKNISDLNKLGVASSTATSAQPEKPASAAPVAAPTVAMAVTPPVVPSSVVARPVAATPETSMIDGLLEDPLIPAGAVALIALLAGFGVYRARQRKAASHVDSSFLESRLRPDSFFGTSGGQSVDTNEGPATGSSMVYSPSQLDSADDVDPVAEADVYLAYGRDLQAEEILKEALRTTPGRVAIHQKLLEIFAKRRDTKRFAEVAATAFNVTGGKGQDWGRICELGLSVDPANPLYQPGGQPSGLQNLPLASQETIAGDIEPKLVAPHASGAVDLDLDFSLDDEPPVVKPINTGAVVTAATAATASTLVGNELDFEFDEPAAGASTAAEVDFDLNAETSAGDIEPVAGIVQDAPVLMETDETQVDVDLSEPSATSATEPEVDFALEASSIAQEVPEPEVDFDLGERSATDPNAPEVNFDLDEPTAADKPEVDFDLDSEEISEPEASLDLDFDLENDAVAPTTPAPALTDALDFDLPDLDINENVLITPDPDNEDFREQAKTSFGATAPAPLVKSEPVKSPAPDLSMLQFDLGSLSLDLDEAPASNVEETRSDTEDPLETKLALAEEFKAIGDDDGARALIEEVISEAYGDMKAKAQRALSNL